MMMINLCLEPKRLQECSQVGVQHQQGMRVRLSTPSSYLLFHRSIRHKPHSDNIISWLALLALWWLGEVLSTCQWHLCWSLWCKQTLVRYLSWSPPYNT